MASWNASFADRAVPQRRVRAYRVSGWCRAALACVALFVASWVVIASGAAPPLPDGAGVPLVLGP
ncbi:MAG TPA: hypothetical protein VME92_04155 [Acetobacteraceae bacterium]|nr:hypothetical protein [Acetobacteraceae bacterium]